MHWAGDMLMLWYLCVIGVYRVSVVIHFLLMVSDDNRNE